jgi:hypothetical protein
MPDRCRRGTRHNNHTSVRQLIVMTRFMLINLAPEYFK